jgi:hypothetical protein
MASSSDELSSEVTDIPEGPRGNPYVIKLYTGFPENNREFELHHFPRLIFNGWVRESFVIRKEIGVPDEEHWDASMYRAPPYNTTDRAILIKGLKQNSGHADHALFCRRPDTDPESMKEMMSNTSAVIASDPERRYGFWLLVFPIEVELDNVILSGNSHEIERHKHGNTKVISGITVATMYVWWQIAIRHGGHRSEPKPTSTASAFD